MTMTQEIFHHPKHYLDRDETIIAMARDSSVLHLGCVGFTDVPSDQRKHLAKETLHWKLTSVADVIGVDYSVDIIDDFSACGSFTNIVACDIQRLEELPVKRTFDVVVAADVIEHLSMPGAMLDGIKPFCGANTKIIITTPHAFGLPNYLRFMSGKFTDGAEHVMTFNFHNIQALLRRHGYIIDLFHTCYQPYAKSHGVLFKIGKTLFNAFPRFGGTIFVVAHLQK